jgi:CheY-like chemotaxis protein
VLTQAGAQVLVVEDDASIRTALVELLELEGYAVRQARHGLEALARVREARPDVIVLDLMMPEMNGWEFVAACKKDELCEGTALVVMSATRSLHEAAVELREQGVQACLAKPFDADALLAIVERYARRGRAAPSPQ